MDSNAKYSRAVLYLLYATVFVMAVARIGDYDIWYHVKAGQYIIQTRAINHLEPFSYAVTDRPWSVQSWLAGVIFYIAYSIADIPGLILFNALVVAGVFYVISRTMRAGGETEAGRLIGVAILIVAAFAMRFRFQVRPHIFEFLFLAGTFFLLELYRTSGKKHYLYAIPVIQALWVNTHASHILGLILPVIYIAGEYGQRFISREGADTARVRDYSRLLGVNILATLINPLFFQALATPLVITGQAAYMRNIGEWQPMQLNHLWGYSLRYTWGFVAMLVAGAASFIYRGRKTRASDALIFIFFLAMAIKGIRLMAEFALAAAPIICRNLGGAGDEWLKARARPAAAALAAMMIAVIIPVTAFSPTYSFGLGVKKNIFPEAAVEFIEANGIKGRVFNSFAFGDYLVGRRFPEEKVFIHGRNEVFPEAFYQDYLDAHKDGAKWREITGRYGVNYALLEYYATDLEGKEAIYHLAGNLNWVPVYWDRVAIVYVKDSPENRDIVARLGFHYIRPSYLDFSYLSKYPRSPALAPALEELGRLIRISPENEEAYLARAYLRFMTGEAGYDQAIYDLKKAVEINPRQAMSRSGLGMLYQRKGMRKEAVAEYNEALRLDPSDPAAKEGLKGLGGG
ncbi:MAG: hypothetical protein HY894_03000 [Deltaproteobacteria bacterium]|nr:hypothetical protein [Deltaproteobacteria bacterium]